MGVAPVNEIALEDAMKEWAGVMTSSPGPMPSARMPSSSAERPESSPTQCAASQYRAYSASNSSTSLPRMKSALAMTRPTAASTSDLISAYWAFRSTSGTCSAADTLSLSPHVRPLEESLEAHELLDLLQNARRVAADHGSGGHVASDYRARSHERACPDAHAGQDGRVAADAHVILHRSAEHAFEVARAHRMRVVGKDHAWPEEDSLAQRDVLKEALAVDAAAGADRGGQLAGLPAARRMTDLAALLDDGSVADMDVGMDQVRTSISLPGTRSSSRCAASST